MSSPNRLTAAVKAARGIAAPAEAGQYVLAVLVLFDIPSKLVFLGKKNVVWSHDKPYSA